MSLDDRLQAELDRLLAEGRELLASVGWTGKDYPHRFPAKDAYIRFRTEALNLVRRTCGEDSDHYRTLRQVADQNR